MKTFDIKSIVILGRSSSLWFNWEADFKEYATNAPRCPTQLKKWRFSDITSSGQFINFQVSST